MTLNFSGIKNSKFVELNLVLDVELGVKKNIIIEVSKKKNPSLKKKKNQGRQSSEGGPDECRMQPQTPTLGK